MLANYAYQKPIINEVLRKLHTDKKVVLAACPGAGKYAVGVLNDCIPIANQ